MSTRTLQKDYTAGTVSLHGVTYDTNLLPPEILRHSAIYGIGIVLQREGAGKDVLVENQLAKADKRWEKLLQGEWRIPSEAGEIIKLKKDDVAKAKDYIDSKEGLTKKEREALREFAKSLGVKF